MWPLLRSVPGARAVIVPIVAVAKTVVRSFYRVALSPFGKVRRSSDAGRTTDLEARTDDYNAAAEKYFRNFSDNEFLMNKPFSEPEEFATRLFSLGVLFKGVRLSPSDVVVDFGAGSCWMSHLIHRFGCQTISVDVSPTALELGRKLFESDPRTDWQLEPEFVAYDGHRLPLADGCCDKVLINDAFHHVPNQRAMLSEFARILRPDGIVGMREPGQDHSLHPVSVQESESGVLENDIVVEELVELAEECGFREAAVIPASVHALVEIEARDIGSFMTGKGFIHYWSNLCNALQNEHFLFLYKGSMTPTTRTPRTLSAEISLAGRRRICKSSGESAIVELWVRNGGDTLWLGHHHENREGWTRLGGHLYQAGEPPTLIDLDWLRAGLPKDLPPDHELKLEVELPALDEPGVYLVEFEMVIEGKCWFGSHQAPAPTIELVVE